MNSLAEQFSTTSALSKLRNIKKLAEDEEISDAMWGSTAGFGNLAKGAPSFAVPNVPDVRVIRSFLLPSVVDNLIAYWFP